MADTQAGHKKEAEMFGSYYGKYLLEKGIINSSQFADLIAACKNSRVKMGLLAVSEGLMNDEQAAEVNRLQHIMDKRVGDIAVSKGYLTDDQVTGLLKKQGDEYLLFLQNVTERNLMTEEEFKKHLNEYKSENGFSDGELEDIKSGDFTKIVKAFSHDDNLLKGNKVPDTIKDYISLVCRNIIRFIDSDFSIGKVRVADEFEADKFAAQPLEGQFAMLTGFTGDGLLTVGSEYAREYFEKIDLDVLDSVCEFLNCCNGLFATNLCDEDVETDMCPPIMKDSQVKVETNGVIYEVPMCIKNQDITLILVHGGKWQLK